MYNIIESHNQLELFSKFRISEAIVFPLWVNDNSPQDLIGIFIGDIKWDKLYYINFTHPECLSLSKYYIKVKDVLRSINTLYVLDKKKFLNFPLNHPKVFDLNFITITPEDNFNTPTHSQIYYTEKDHPKLNFLVPITKIYEKYNNIFSKIKELTEQPQNEYLNNIVSPTYYMLEKNLPENPYNLYSVSHRINGKYSTLKKEDKGIIEPKNDCLFELDYSSYHLYFLAQLTDFKITKDNIYSQIWDTEFDNPEEYNEFKQKTFQILYTSQINNFTDNMFFKGVLDLKNQIEQDLSKRGHYAIDSLYLGQIEKATQILPYILHVLETQNNIKVIREILLYLTNKKSNLILVNFDSFLIDYSKEDGKEVIDSIINILEQDYYKVSLSYGKNYNNLKKLKI